MRWLFRIVGLLIVIAIIGVVSLLLLPSERIAKIAADQISRITGREVTMRGETKLSFYPVLGVSTGKVTIANAGWSDKGPMFTADSLKIGVEASSLWGDDIKITGIETSNPEILLEKAADGRVNWEIGVEGVAPSGQSEGGQTARSSPLSLTLDRALIRDAQLTYIDHGAGETTQIRDINLDLKWPDYNGEATFEGALRPFGEVISFDGRLDKVGDFFAGEITPFAVALEAPGGSVSLSGRAGVQPQFAGPVTAALGDTQRFLAALGAAGVALPEGFGKSLDMTGRLSLSEDLRLSLRDMALDLGGNQVGGALDLLLGGARPVVNAQLDAGALDLAALAGADSNESGGGGGAGGADGWSKAPIDASALALADGEVALEAESVNLGDLQLGKTDVLMTLDNARAVFILNEIQAYDGVLTGEFVANNRSGLSVGGDMRIAQVNLETLLSDALDVTRFAAKGDAQLQFLGVGQSVDSIMRSLEGRGNIKTGRGVISGIDLDRLMRSGDASGGTTVFDEMSASFTMEGGNLRNDDLLMNLPLAKAEGEGRVGLGARDIDYLFTPTLLEGEKAKGLAIPVRIKGPWSDPRILPDLEKAIDLNFKEEKRELKENAREEVSKALEKELGVKVEEGQSVEDAVQRRLEEKAGRELRKLFE